MKHVESDYAPEPISLAKCKEYTLTRDVSIDYESYDKFIQSGGKINGNGYRLFISAPASVDD